jgi:hypothetical protein
LELVGPWPIRGWTEPVQRYLARPSFCTGKIYSGQDRVFLF